jgi:endonuclease/exonuclease/phosphatase family metal-dependent hydrolase
MRIRVLSWNVHGLPYPITADRPQRMARIAERIAAEAPHVVVLQEVWPGALTTLEPLLPDYGAFYQETSIGSPAGGIVVFVRRDARWTVEATAVEFRAFSCCGPWYRLWEGDGIAGKGALFVPLQHSSGRMLHVVGTHLQSRYGASDYADVRRAQIEQIRQWVADAGGTAIVAGDFNTPATDESMYASIAAIGIDLTAAERAKAAKPVTNFPIHSDAGWIDYVLLRPGDMRLGTSSLRLIENESIDDPYSDHSGLVADVALEPAGDAPGNPETR